MSPCSAYLPGRELARGGAGMVLDARDTKLGRSVAMKVMLHRNASDVHRQRFLQEARVLGQLAHPNIVPIHDLGADEQGRPFYIMKLVVGVTLHEIIGKLKAEDRETLAKYPLNALLTIFQKVCDAVGFAHSRGIIHRDLKPTNIMVGEFGEVLVMDWGLAKILPGAATAEEAKTTPMSDGQLNQTEPAGTLPLEGRAGGQVTMASGATPLDQATLGSGADATNSTQTLNFDANAPESAAPKELYQTLEGAVIGTPKFMSPEQAEGKIAELDGRSDIFSLGGILYVLLTLRPPVEGDSLEEILAKVRSGTITPPTTFNAPSFSVQARPDATGALVEPRQIHPLTHCPGGKVPSALSAVAMKALTRDKAGRYQTVAEFAADIAAYQGGFATTAEKAGLFVQLRLLVKRHQREFAVGFAAWLIITALAVWFVINLRAEKYKAVEGEQKAVAAADRATKAEKVAEEKGQAARVALARSQTSLAEAAYREFDSQTMLTSLESVPESLRDADWRYLRARADNSQTRFAFENDMLFFGVAAHPKRPGVFAVALPADQLALVDAPSGRILFQFPVSERQQRSEFTRSLDFSPDGSRLIVSRLGNSGVSIYETASGRPLVEWDAVEAEFVHFSRDGSRALDIGANGLTVHDTVSGRELWRAQGVSCAAFSPGGEVITVNQDTSVRTLDGATGSILRTLPALPWGAKFMVLSPAGATFFAGCWDGVVRGMRLADGAVVFEQRLTESISMPHIAISGSGDVVAAVAVVSESRRVGRAWLVRSGIPVWSMMGSRGGIEGMAMHPTTSELLVTGPDSRSWALVTTRSMESALPASVTAGVFWGADDVFVAQNQPAKLDVNGQWTPLPIEIPPECANADRFASSGDIAAMAIHTHPSETKPSLTIYRRTPGGASLLSQLRTEFTVAKVRVSRDGARVATVNDYSSIEIFDTMSGQGLAKVSYGFTMTRNVCDMAWIGPDRLVTVGNAGARGATDSEERIVLWDATTGKALRHVTHPFALDRVAVAPDGRTFAEGGDDKRVRIRDAETLAVLREFRAHDGRITALTFHPTLPVLATASTDRTVRLWRLDDLSTIEELRFSSAETEHLAFSPSGKRLAATDRTSVASIFNLESPPLGQLKRIETTIASIAPADPGSASAATTPGTQPKQPPHILAQQHANAGRWAEARIAMMAVLQQNPAESGWWLYLASVLAQLGDRDAHRQFVHAMLERFAASNELPDLDRCIKAGSLLPLEAMDATDIATMTRWANRIASEGGTSPLLSYYELSVALVRYRTGDFAGVVSGLAANPERGVPEIAVSKQAVLALAQHLLGKKDEARAALARAETLDAEKLPQAGADLGPGWSATVVARLLLREARELLGPAPKP